MITPDSKDWTWVLERRCTDCGFDASTCTSDAVSERVIANAQAWEQLLAAGAVRAGRPDDATWSSLEYACHVRDVYRRYNQRVALMLDEDDPLFPNWDQDASAIDEHYEKQDPELVVAEIRAAADALAERLRNLTDPEWERPGRRSDGASFTIDTISRYMIHDPTHHLWDVTKHL